MNLTERARKQARFDELLDKAESLELELFDVREEIDALQRALNKP